VDYLACFCPF